MSLHSVPSRARSKGDKLGYYRTSVACSYCRKRKARCKPALADPKGRCITCVRRDLPCVVVKVEVMETLDLLGDDGTPENILRAQMLIGHVKPPAVADWIPQTHDCVASDLYVPFATAQVPLESWDCFPNNDYGYLEAPLPELRTFESEQHEGSQSVSINETMCIYEPNRRGEAFLPDTAHSMGPLATEDNSCSYRYLTPQRSTGSDVHHSPTKRATDYFAYSFDNDLSVSINDILASCSVYPT